MYLRGVVSEGLDPSGPVVVRGAGRAQPLPDGATAGRIADAIELWAAALDPVRLRAVARSLLGSEVTLVGEGEEPAVDGLDPAEVRALVPVGTTVTVEAEVSLDPALYGRLREHAHRDPRVVAALAGDGTLTVKAGWLFSRDLTHAAPSVLGVRAGDVVFETAGKERPVWLPGLVAELGRRVWRTDPLEPVDRLAPRLHEASLSSDPHRRAGLARAFRQAASPPFSLPEPGLVRSGAGVALCFGPELRRLRSVGRSAWDVLRWLEGAWVERPDVLVIAEPLPQEVRESFEALVDADDAPVEQVWFA
ncbi:MAG: hypothetical protein H6735_10130 [Alphaproteobacteria bacterium]|nr:hypothetical protein [Alphaproteobacteria bacterium]